MQRDLKVRANVALPEYYNKFQIPTGHFQFEAPVYEKELYSPGDEDALIHGVIKSHHLGDMIYNLARRLSTSIKKVLNLVDEKLTKYRKFMARTTPISHMKRANKLRISQMRESKINSNMFKILAGQASFSGSNPGSLGRFSLSTINELKSETLNAISSNPQFLRSKPKNPSSLSTAQQFAPEGDTAPDSIKDNSIENADTSNLANTSSQAAKISYNEEKTKQKRSGLLKMRLMNENNSKASNG